MQNPFKSSDDQVKGDTADQEHAGGRSEGDAEPETKEAGYRDDPSQLAASSDYAQRGTTNQYSGQMPGDESGNFASGREVRGMHSGSQEQWRGAAAAPSGAGADEANAAATPADGEAHGDVPSRSADPGDSSAGGFKDEGPSSHDAAGPKASDDDAKAGDTSRE